uniref:Transmembrane protein n=1 Tax=Syphacia muris TaxID=451379 RepID=A0A0N5A9D0_9BILA
MSKSFYIRQVPVTHMMYLLLNVYVGNIVVVATVSQAAITFYQYFSGFISGTLPKNYYDEFNISPIWKDYTSYEARMKNIYPLVDNSKNKTKLRKRRNNTYKVTTSSDSKTKDKNGNSEDNISLKSIAAIKFPNVDVQQLNEQQSSSAERCRSKMKVS